VRVRVVLAVAVLAVAVALVIDMSGRAQRTAGSNHNNPVVFAAVVPGGGVVCQADQAPPSDAAEAHLLVGTYGLPVPALELDYLSSTGEVVAAGRLPAGAIPPNVTIHLSRARGEAARACLHVGGSHKLAVGGETGPANPSTDLVDGVAAGGRFSLLYTRRGEESWWQLLTTLDTRFGLGKASMFGDWTLPVMALLLLGVWVATLRLLLRELT